MPLLTTGALAELGYRVRAVDVAPERFAGAIARLDLDVRKCDVETEPLPFEAESVSDWAGSRRSSNASPTAPER